MAKRFYIKGLVALANRVRRELGGGVSAERLAALRRQVERSCADVMVILEENGARVGHLPAPSRRALQYLQQLDFDQIPAAAGQPRETPTGGAPSSPASLRHIMQTADKILGKAHRSAPERPATESIRFRGLKALADRQLDRLCEVAVAPDDDAAAASLLRDVGRTIETTSRRLEATVHAQELTAAHLSEQTRSLRGWFGYFSKEPHRAQYLAALRRLLRALEQSDMPKCSLLRLPTVIHYRPSKSLYRARERDQACLITLPTPMITIDDPGAADLAAFMLGDAGRRRAVYDLAMSPAYQQLQNLLVELGGEAPQPRGVYFDLDEVFERINRQYFAAGFDKPRLIWSHRITGRKFGHYDAGDDTVMLSATLDAPTTPAYLVDYVVFHELLHKKHGEQWQNGRRHVHTPAFLREEKQFADFKKAVDTLEKLARLYS